MKGTPVVITLESLFKFGIITSCADKLKVTKPIRVSINIFFMRIKIFDKYKLIFIG